ncbi:MAG: DUF2269 family protein [Caldilineaceae bacterium]
MTLYTLFKFLHIVGAIGWIGGIASFTLLNARIVRESNAAVLVELTRLMRLNGMVVIGPSSGVALITGIAMITFFGFGAPLWVIWGFVVIILSVALGATMIRRTAEQVRVLAAATTHDDSRLTVLQRQLTTLNLINLLLLLSAVWAMVAKPTL